MNRTETVLSLRYAKAFLNISPEKMSDADFKAVKDGHDFFMQHRQALFLMRLSVLDSRVKEEALSMLCKQLGLSERFRPLLVLLIDHKRSSLFPELFHQLYNEYKKRQGIMVFTVSSSIDLSMQQKIAIEKGLQKLVGKIIFCSYRIDSSLIAGIRLQSDEHLWETSLRQRLQRIEHSLLHR